MFKNVIQCVLTRTLCAFQHSAGAVSKVTSAWARGTHLMLVECAASHAGRGRAEKEFWPCTEAARQLQVV
jgi:hypothetical protein